MKNKLHNKFNELEELLSKLFDGIANDEDTKRIEELLSGDPEACEFYIDYSELCAQMEFELGAKPLLILMSKVFLHKFQNQQLSSMKDKTLNKY